ncbi:Fc.00g030100.m01.CDS01 [Cosmosporella sp. VM-42]
MFRARTIGEDLPKMQCLHRTKNISALRVPEFELVPVLREDSHNAADDGNSTHLTDLEGIHMDDYDECRQRQPSVASADDSDGHGSHHEQDLDDMDSSLTQQHSNDSEDGHQGVPALEFDYRRDTREETLSLTSRTSDEQLQNDTLNQRLAEDRAFFRQETHNDRKLRILLSLGKPPSEGLIYSLLSSISPVSPVFQVGEEGGKHQHLSEIRNREPRLISQGSEPA